ncbi:hypothetical protein BV898_07424 [Hypsibius exemplaris]|uniref:HMG box domain-containing protein n=1 Tax=Hypsibius exemplaris TaxID=2072580 RepID=A0A1W0WTT1_HYPEX|nr:hypothetical protein BV898_07424 [Hypsibius exemplaris]
MQANPNAMPYPGGGGGGGGHSQMNAEQMHHHRQQQQQHFMQQQQQQQQQQQPSGQSYPGPPSGPPMYGFNPQAPPNQSNFMHAPPPHEAQNSAGGMGGGPPGPMRSSGVHHHVGHGASTSSPKIEHAKSPPPMYSANSKPPKGPAKPLIPYLRFSKSVWEKVKTENPGLQFAEIGRIIGKQWRECSDEVKARITAEHKKETEEYVKAQNAFMESPEMVEWTKHKSRLQAMEEEAEKAKALAEQQHQAKAAAAANAAHSRALQQQQQQQHHQSSASASQPSGGFAQLLQGPLEELQSMSQRMLPGKHAGNPGQIQSNQQQQAEIDDDADDFLRAKHVASSRYRRNQKLMADTFSESLVPDGKMLVNEQRITLLRKQVQSLAHHQVMLVADKKEMMEKQAIKRQKLLDDSEAFDVKWAAVKEECKSVTKEQYQAMVEKYHKMFEKHVAEYQAQQAAARTQQEQSQKVADDLQQQQQQQQPMLHIPPPLEQVPQQQIDQYPLQQHPQQQHQQLMNPPAQYPRQLQQQQQQQQMNPSPMQYPQQQMTPPMMQYNMAPVAAAPIAIEQPPPAAALPSADFGLPPPIAVSPETVRTTSPLDALLGPPASPLIPQPIPVLATVPVLPPPIQEEVQNTQEDGIPPPTVVTADTDVEMKDESAAPITVEAAAEVTPATETTETSAVENVSETSVAIENVNESSVAIENVSETSVAIENVSEISGAIENVSESSVAVENVSETSVAMENVSESSVAVVQPAAVAEEAAAAVVASATSDGNVDMDDAVASDDIEMMDGTPLVPAAEEPVVETVTSPAATVTSPAATVEEVAQGLSPKPAKEELESDLISADSSPAPAVTVDEVVATVPTTQEGGKSEEALEEAASEAEKVSEAVKASEPDTETAGTVGTVEPDIIPLVEPSPAETESAQAKVAVPEAAEEENVESAVEKPATPLPPPPAVVVEQEEAVMGEQKEAGDLATSLDSVSEIAPAQEANLVVSPEETLAPTAETLVAPAEVVPVVSESAAPTVVEEDCGGQGMADFRL